MDQLGEMKRVRVVCNAKKGIMRIELVPRIVNGKPVLLTDKDLKDQPGFTVKEDTSGKVMVSALLNTRHIGGPSYRCVLAPTVTG